MRFAPGLPPGWGVKMCVSCDACCFGQRVKWGVHVRQNPDQRQLLLHNPDVISRKVFIKLFCKIQFPHKSVNVLFITEIMKDTLTDLCGNWFLQNDCINPSCEIRPSAGCQHVRSCEAHCFGQRFKTPLIRTLNPSLNLSRGELNNRPF